MQKNPNRKDIQDKPIPKGKRVKRVTACVDKRRDGNHCGICGSSEIVWHGVTYCELCHKESEHQITANTRWGLYPDFERKRCDCNHYWASAVYVGSCIACGASYGPLCPNCKSQHWYHWNGNKHYCRKCGFRC